ncbi:hypothetical protein SAMN05443377_1276 [Propionibacterium cyclohexanicum]|uniref:Uncharacterized protein n=1 Tax=Propionibacterium cyclohexanicum TaxID=64702 RepID=A0A1H9TS26_9ACTN|nr:hypothetical protein [Propionibacterium cyclohexanicum]SER99828.1 hypothetical protein SAMN05443377_1276 [Propionibacterium cyclohexanicum]
MNDDQYRSHGESDDDPTGRTGAPQEPADSEETVILPRHSARRGYSPHGDPAEPGSSDARDAGSDSERTRAMGAIPPSHPDESFATEASANAPTQSLPPVAPVETGYRERDTGRTRAFPGAQASAPDYGHGASASNWQGHFVGAGAAGGAAGGIVDDEPEPPTPRNRSTNKILLRVLQVLAAFLILFIGVGIGSFVSGTPAPRSSPGATQTVTSTTTATTTTTATPVSTPTIAPPPVTITETVLQPARTETVTQPAQTVTSTVQGPARPAVTVTQTVPAQQGGSGTGTTP